MNKKILAILVVFICSLLACYVISISQKPQIPPLEVGYVIVVVCNIGEPIYEFIFEPSGGKPDYEYSPAEPFTAQPDDFQRAWVKSADGQTWEEEIRIPRHNCSSGESPITIEVNPSGRRIYGSEGNDTTVGTANARCRPIRNDSNCKGDNKKNDE